MTLLMLGGCATSNDVVKAKIKGAGTTAIYSVPVDQAWLIAKTVFRWEGSDAIEEFKEQGYMLTSSGADLLSQGTVMGAWVTELGPESVEITTITKRRVQIDPFTTLTESTFHKRFAQAVEIIKGGASLPEVAPK
ncbi:hypothetical protein B0T39_24535 [Chromobacterium haemolyticum]|nr:hypothetical protein B0T39_24535 [Chromobacterium haemolyticum]